MVTYVSKMFATTAEAEEQLSTYQPLILEAGGTIDVKTWERQDTDKTTRAKETTASGETTAEVTTMVETKTQRGPVLYITLPEQMTLSTLVTGSDTLEFKVVA